MAKAALRKKFSRLIGRAREQAAVATVQIALRKLGYQGSGPPTEKEIDTLLTEASNEMAQDAIDALSTYQGPAQTYPEQTLETAARWQTHFESLRGQVPEYLLRKARILAQVEELGDPTQGRVSPDWEESRWCLYRLLGGKILESNLQPAECDKGLGVICDIGREEFRQFAEVIARVTEQQDRERIRQEVFERFVTEAGSKPLQQDLRRRIVKILRAAKTREEAEEEMQHQSRIFFTPNRWATALQRLKQLFDKAGP